MLRRACITAVFGILGYCLCLQVGWAAMSGLSTEQLTRNAACVVQGQVVETRAHWTGDGQTIVTTVTVSVSDVVKGEVSGETIDIEYPGGEVDDIGLKVSDVKVPPSGSNVLMFLKPVRIDNFSTIYQLFGKAQGQYSIDENNLATKSGFSLVEGQDRVDNPISLQELINKIRAVENE